jgi:hypothetical protein
MTAQEHARLDLIELLPDKVRAALRSGDEAGVAHALDALTENERERVRDVLRELAALPNRFPLKPDEHLGPAGDALRMASLKRRKYCFGS